MVPYRRSTELPLLPFEKRLIAELGCTEAEYRAFADEVRNHPYIRPAEYAYVPDVRGEVGTIIAVISLVVGLASTAASYLLAPKPQQAEASRIKSKQLGSRTGRDVFTPTYGFDTIQELAAYGTAVPIVFTKQESHIDSTGTAYVSGGVLISPLLVWSRVRSWGSYQVADVIAVAGQGPMAKPDLSGIFLGNIPIDALYDQFYEFYWNAGYEVLGPGSRLRMYNLRYGDFALEGATDRGSNEQAFICPTALGNAQAGFSGTFTPTSQTQFGVFSGIPNGTAYRPDWKIISVPDEWDSDQRGDAREEIKKYVPRYLRVFHPFGAFGMPGTGVNYASRIGVVAHKAVGSGTFTKIQPVTIYDGSQSDPKRWTNVKRDVAVEIGDEIIIKIGCNRQDKTPFESKANNAQQKVKADDVRNAVESAVARADQILKRGATVMLGRTMWQVVSRDPDEYYRPALARNGGINIRLKCIEAWGEATRRIGIVASDAIKAEDFVQYAAPFDEIDEAWYPILRYETAVIQNTRRCDVTEIGIKSRVWARLNNITNFNSLPTPFELAGDGKGDKKSYNKRNVVLREGKLTKYVHRVSFFALDVRPSNSDAARDRTDNDGWTFLGPYLFAVMGSAPVDLYSFIRIRHPDRGQYEYRFRPFNSACFAHQGDGGFEVFKLDGGHPGLRNLTADGGYADGWETYMGKFVIYARGEYIRPRDWYYHREMAGDPSQIDSDGDGIIDLSLATFQVAGDGLGDVDLDGVVAAENTPTFAINSPISKYTLSNIMSGALGEDPYSNNLPDRTIRKLQGWTAEAVELGNRSIAMEVTLESYTEANPGGAPRNKWWRIIEHRVTAKTGEWSNGDTFVKYSQNAAGYRFKFVYTYKKRYIVNEDDIPATRMFQRFSGIAEVSHYGDLIARSCDDSPEHEVVYVNECLDEESIPQYDNCAVTGLKLRSTENFNQLDQLRCLMANGIEVERLADGGTGPSNLLTDLFWYLCTDKDTGAGAVISPDIIDRNALAETGKFLEVNQLYFDDAISEPLNLRSWIAETAPSVLCYTTLKNGKMAIEPALPYDSAHQIDATKPVAIAGMFTDGNIIEGSLGVEWLELEQRKMFQASIAYKWTGINKFPEQRTVIMRYTEDHEQPIESFEFSHITSDEHARKIARYFLALRKYITHTITFRTLPWGLRLAPGNFIRVATEVSPYNPSNNGIIKADGTVVSVAPLSDGAYNVYFWDRSQPQVSTGTLTIANGIATNLRNAVFSVVNSNVSNQVYQVEALDIDTDGIVTVKASNHPVDSNGASLIARDVLDLDQRFTVVDASFD
jgi:hypothetical protein